MGIITNRLMIKKFNMFFVISKIYIRMITTGTKSERIINIMKLRVYVKVLI